MGDTVVQKESAMRAASLLAAVALVASPALAQTDAPGDDALGVIEDCQLVPEGEGATGGADTLTEALAPCNGVIAPPPAGDADMTIVPPPVGETPIIPPEQVPEQPADAD